MNEALIAVVLVLGTMLTYSDYRTGADGLPVPGKAVVLHDERPVLVLDVEVRFLERAARPEAAPGRGDAAARATRPASRTPCR